MGQGHLILSRSLLHTSDSLSKGALTAFLRKGHSERHVVDHSKDEVKIYLHHPDFVNEDESQRYILQFATSYAADHVRTIKLHSLLLYKDDNTLEEVKHYAT